MTISCVSQVEHFGFLFCIPKLKPSDSIQLGSVQPNYQEARGRCTPYRRNPTTTSDGTGAVTVKGHRMTLLYTARCAALLSTVDLFVHH